MNDYYIIIVALLVLLFSCVLSYRAGYAAGYQAGEATIKLQSIELSNPINP